MRDSIRARLLLWYTLVLAILIALYAGTVAYAYWRSLIADVDASLAATAATITESVTPDVSGALDLDFPPRFRDTAFGPAADGAYYLVWNAAGELVDRSESAPERTATPPPGASTRGAARELVVQGPGGSRVLVGRPLAGVFQSVRSLGLTIAGTGALVLVLSLAGGFFLAGRALAPIARISRTAGAMVGGDLDARIPVQDTDSELEQVARALNDAFDRLQAALERQRQFTADASHEFRTPLATLRGEFEWALKKDRTPEAYRTSIVKAQKAVDRLIDISDRLLTLAERRHGVEMRRTPVELASVVTDVVELLQPLAAERHVTVQTDLEPGWVRGDRSLLTDAISNLLTNGIQYNREGGLLAVSLRQEALAVRLVVRDTGIGIDPADLPQIFDRFYRADQSRGRGRGGAGLGLAIVREIVEAHGGRVTCASAAGVGTEFTVTVPAAP